MQNLTLEKTQSWEMFDRISSRYDLLNHILSWGMDILWRYRMRAMLPKKEKLTVLDLATGTGDVLIALTQRNPKIKVAVGVDLSENMLTVGRQKIHDRGLNDRIQLVTGDAMKLHFSDQTFDVTTIAFGIRNMPNPITTLMEMFRVTRSGGCAMVLEFSLPENFILAGLDLIYLRLIVPFIGGLLTGQWSAYRYLNRTIEKFPYGEQFVNMMKQVGFTKMRTRRLLFGAATIYRGEKP